MLTVFRSGHDYQSSSIKLGFRGANVYVLSRCSCVRFFATPCQFPLSMRFSRQECRSGLPCPPPGDLSNPGTRPGSLMSPALVGRFFTTGTTWEVLDPKHQMSVILSSYCKNKKCCIPFPISKITPGTSAGLS